MILNHKLTEEEVFVLLKKQLEKSYAKYSNFFVASILETQKEDEYQYYFGNNIENASYGLTICAERNVICNFLSNKFPNEEILNLYLLATNKNSSYEQIILPCGACLQFIQEFFKENNHIFCYSINMDRKIFKINDLLPQSFELNKKKEK
ncbi:cytidine deaminase [bacterium]|nr:cytidine deaminase [bacterium]